MRTRTRGGAAVDGQVDAEQRGEVSTTTGYVPALDGVRAFAIAAVWLLHLDRAHFPGGAVGVDVFFALSAYLITGILLDERRHGRFSFAAFYWRRALRLVPALIAWVIVLAVPTALLNHDGPQLVWTVPGTLVYINDFLQAFAHGFPGAFDQTWSLAVEEQFYLLWPAILLFGVYVLSRRQQQIVFPTLAVVAIVVLLLSGNRGYFLPTGHLLPLVLGAWAAWSKPVRSAMPGHVARPVGLVALCFLAITVFIDAHTTAEFRALSISTAVAATALIMVADSGETTWPNRLLASPVAVWVGARSYGIYLYGLTVMPLVGATTHLALHYAVLIDLPATLVIAEISFRYLESPIRHAGRVWLATRNDGSPALTEASHHGIAQLVRILPSRRPPD